MLREDFYKQDFFSETQNYGSPEACKGILFCTDILGN